MDIVSNDLIASTRGMVLHYNILSLLLRWKVAHWVHILMQDIDDNDVISFRKIVNDMAAGRVTS